MTLSPTAEVMTHMSEARTWRSATFAGGQAARITSGNAPSAGLGDARSTVLPALYAREDIALSTCRPNAPNARKASAIRVQQRAPDRSVGPNQISQSRVIDEVHHGCRLVVGTKIF